jgi:hypothetical protein
MYKFFSTFYLRDPSIWGDLSYEDAHQMLETLKEKKKDVVNKTAKKIIKDSVLGTSTPSNPRTLPNRPTKIEKST